MKDRVSEIFEPIGSLGGNGDYRTFVKANSLLILSLDSDKIFIPHIVQCNFGLLFVKLGKIVHAMEGGGVLV